MPDRAVVVTLSPEHAALLREEADNKAVVLRGERAETVNPEMKVWLEARIAMWDAVVAQLRRREIPDRAAVDDKRNALLAEYEAWAVGELSEISDEAMAAGRAALRAQNDIDWKETPRALVALSEDRQWLVAPDATWPRFVIFALEDDDYGGGYLRVDSVEDIGQDAHEVLASWLKEREA